MDPVSGISSIDEGVMKLKEQINSTQQALVPLGTAVTDAETHAGDLTAQSNALLR